MKMQIDLQEKVKLMHFLVDELAQHELDPARYFTAGDKHVVWSPYDEHKAAYQLQQHSINRHEQICKDS
jgi:hypothetical protein